MTTPTPFTDASPSTRLKAASPVANPVRYLNTATMGSFAVVHAGAATPAGVERTFIIDPKESFVVFRVVPTASGRSDLLAVYYGWGPQAQSVVTRARKEELAVFAFVGDASVVTEAHVSEAWQGANHAPPGRISVQPG